ncbi:molybdenum cofactor guanylyltransferase [Streptomyces sp. NPDC048595]|uniref:molybdenum cofactor guanylyltransferase n=1 Tax=Streptomyces sp. NPDC048595 TaxID=3365576 RepID=UPI00372039DF
MPAEDTGWCYDAVVLAGGRARRLGGADKPMVSVGGMSLLDRALQACGGAERTIVVGPHRATIRPVHHVQESPVHGGPLAALAAGVHWVRAPFVVVLAADLPFVRRETVTELLRQAAGSGTEGAVMLETQGRDNPLFAAYRTAAVRRGLALTLARHGALTGLPVRVLTHTLALRHVPDVGGVSVDCDTWEVVALARAILKTEAGPPHSEHEFVPLPTLVARWHSWQ